MFYSLSETSFACSNLYKQVLNLQRQLSKFLGNSGVQTSVTSLMLLLLTFMLICSPSLDPRRLLPATTKGDVQSAANIFPGRSRMLLQSEYDASQSLGQPYLVTVRPATLPWQQPPLSPNVKLQPIGTQSPVQANYSQPVVIDSILSNDL